MSFIVLILDWIKSIGNSVNGYVSSIFILSIFAYIIVWGLKKAFPQFWNVLLYNKVVYKPIKNAEGEEIIVKSTKEKKMNTLIPLFVSLVSFLVFLIISKGDAKAAGICGTMVSLFSSTLDNIVNILFNTYASVVGLLKRVFAKKDGEDAEAEVSTEVRVSNLEGKLDTLIAALAPQSAKNSKNENSSLAV